MTDFDSIQAAARRIDGHVVRTPLLNAPLLDELAGRKVYVKAECLQTTGSFKLRGAWSAVSKLAPEVRARGVLAFSSGNHAQGVAYAARAHGVPAVIIMPSDAPKLKIENTRAYGAEVVLYDRYNENRDAIGAQISSERGLTLIRPFDDEQVIAGQGTVGLEIAEQAAEAGIGEAAVLVPCGGGGLTSGIALALAETAPHLKVHPCEPQGFDDTARSLAAGEALSVDPSARSICDAILTPKPGNITFPLLKKLCGAGLVVSDDEALQAVAAAYTRLKIVVEPGAAVALAAALFRKDQIEGDAVIVVASGGNADFDVYARAFA